MANPNWYVVKGNNALITGGPGGTYNTDQQGHLLNYDRVWRTTGLVVMNNTANPSTQLDIDADMVAFHPTAGYNVVATPGPITLDINLAGPIANGRDQAAAIGNSTFFHVYYIATVAQTPTIATIASLTPPPTGPTLPTGYTQWAYVGTYIKDNLGGIPYIRQFDNLVQYAWGESDTRKTIVNAGQSTSFATTSAASVVPPNCRLALLEWILSLTHSVAGTTFFAYYRPSVGPVTSEGFAQIVAVVQNTAVIQDQRQTLPTWLSATQTFDVRINSVPNVSGGVYINVVGYYVPN